MYFLIVGLNINTAPLDVREQFYFQDDRLDNSLNMLLPHKSIKEAVIFSNKDMVEIYVVAANHETALARINELFASYHDSSLGVLDDYIYIHRDLDAIRHLFYVACGFESMLVDDPNILPQLTGAFTYCMNHNSSGKVINNIIESARVLAESKEISRIKIQYLSSRSTICFAATELTKKLFDNITALNVLFIGGGELGEEVVMSLANIGVKSLAVTNRSFEIACKNADELYGRAVAIDNLLDELLRADIVICSTGSQYYIVSMEHMSYAMKRRRQKPIMLIDISCPRNIDPDIDNIDNVYLYDIDDMGGFSNASMNAYQKGNDQIKAIIEKEAELFWIEKISK